MPDVVARACSNVALVKYWGKRSGDLNLPYTGSISVTLDGLWTTVALTRRPRGEPDSIRSASADLSQRPELTSFMSLMRSIAPSPTPVQVEVDTNFPVAAGLASSASIFAALTCAVAAAFGIKASERELTLLARRGSGSAARSISGGFVEWFAGERSDGGDSYAQPILAAESWPLGIVVAVTDSGPKRVSSRVGMQHVTATSPFFAAWLETHDGDLQAVRRAILASDLTEVGVTAEHNCLKMHAVTMAARPGLIYWNPVTLAVIERIRSLRDEGVEAYFTIDAGPQVKVLCQMDQRAHVADQLARIPGVQQTLLSQPGRPAEILESR